MHRVIAGATGLIGKRLTERWLKNNITITVIGRSGAHIKQVFGERVKVVTWEEVNAEIFAGVDAVINLAGASVGDKRWSAARKQEILSSRIDSTKKIASLLATLGTSAPTLLNASGIGIYGLQPSLPDALPQALDENILLDKENAPDFLAEVARRAEESAQIAIAKGVRVIFLRFAVVLAKEGGALPQLMFPFKCHMGGPIGNGRQPFSWVAIDDVLRAIDFLIDDKGAHGPYNIVSPVTVTQKTFAETLAHILNKPSWFSTPDFALKMLLGEERANLLLLNGQHVYPKRLLDMGFRFAYPDLESAFNRIFK